MLRQCEFEIEEVHVNVELIPIISELRGSANGKAGQTFASESDAEKGGSRSLATKAVKAIVDRVGVMLNIADELN